MGDAAAGVQRVLVTGGTGAVGTGVMRHLRDRAHVTLMARNRPDALPDDVSFMAADIRDVDAVRKAVVGIDAVIHLAWAVSVRLTHEATEAINVGGTRNLIDACLDEGVRRLVFCSSVTAYGSDPGHEGRWQEADELHASPDFDYAFHKKLMEQEISASGLDHVLVRLGTVLGRRVENSVARVFTGPVVTGIKGAEMTFQFVHQDDAGRFFAMAALGGPTGPVNLAADDELDMRRLAELTGRRYVELSEDAALKLVKAMFRLGASEVDPEAMAALRDFPIVDTTRLREDWGFDLAWSSAATARDMARAGSRFVSVGPKVFGLPWRLPYVEPEPIPTPPSDGGGLVDLLPEPYRGEFDCPLDPRYEEYTSTNVSEAFPGPMTPLTLTVALNALRASAQGISDIFGFSGPVAEELVHRGPVSLGHRMYVNISATRQMSEMVPGMTPGDIDHQYLGKPMPTERPRPTLRDVVQGLRLAFRGAPRMAGLAREAERAHADADELTLSADDLRALSDTRLVAHLGLVHDQLIQAWNVACIMNMVSGGAWSTLERVVGVEAAARLRTGGASLASAATIQGVERLARRARDDAALADVLRSRSPGDALAEVRRSHRGFARDLERLLDTVGHRGPGETELANEVFADRPDLLIEAIAKAMGATARTSQVATPRGFVQRRLVSLAGKQLRTRERARDAAMRLTHALRLAARERGARLAGAGTLASGDDVFYLTLDEIKHPPADAAAVVARRRRERERLASQHLPGFLTIGWQPTEERREGDTIEGLAAAPGTYVGRARVLASLDGLEPGEVLVTKVTDVGWTALFAYAGAIVTDLGGSMSHAAVVAREVGVPAVVGTQDATTRIRTGDLIEVDGTTGVVRLLGGRGADAA